jgi:hypothetical protein
MSNTHPTEPPKPIRHFNQTELARRWGISPRSLERWRWQGIGPRYQKLNGRVCYREADILEYEAAALIDLVEARNTAKGGR